MVMLWKILFFIFIHLINFFLFYFIYVLCFTHDVIITHDVMGDYVYEVLRCNKPLMSWQMEKPILFFIN